MNDKKYFSVVTEIGLRKMADAIKNGNKIIVDNLIVGDANGSYYEPKPEMQTLINVVWEGTISSYEISENVLTVTAIIPGDVGGFTVREIGLVDETGDLIAIGNLPETPKVTIIDGIVNEMSITMEITLTGRDIVELIIDPTIVTATKDDVEKLQKRMEKVNYISLLLNGWSEEAPYTQTIAVEGMKETDTPIIGFQYPKDIDKAQKKAIDKSVAMITEIITAKGEVTVICKFDKPTADILMGLKGV